MGIATTVTANSITNTRDNGELVLLFNPWSPEDECHLDNEEHLKEYVLNENGAEFYGTYRRIGMTKWFHGQFEKDVLPCILELLDEEVYYIKNPNKAIQKRRNVVQMTRCLAALINCSDDKGVLWGRWDGEYSDGTSPTKWSGSVKILREWKNSGHKPVKYGQCWVFSGVLTTVLRCLGIPARSVTNFASAHDTESSITVDDFFDAKGKPIDVDGSSDSTWNFHVWNEAWMKRNDLPTDCDNHGWQACDATPQEESAGLMQCGPVPCKAVKEGRIWVNYDAPFVYAEVNSDRCYWQEKHGGGFALVKRKKNEIGKNISTKAVGEMAREDVTGHYKFAEFSEDERNSFELAYAHGSRPRYQAGQIIEQDGEGFDVEIDFPESTLTAVVGDNFTTNISVHNKTSQSAKKVIINALIHTTLYNNKKHELVKSVEFEASIGSGEKFQEQITVSWDEYFGKLVDRNDFLVTCSARIDELGDDRLYVDTSSCQLESPSGCVEVIVPQKSPINKSAQCFIKVKNPLQCVMNHITVTIEGFGIEGGTWQVESTEVNAGDTLKIGPLDFVPTRRGPCPVYVDVDSKQVQNLKHDVIMY